MTTDAVCLTASVSHFMNTHLAVPIIMSLLRWALTLTGANLALQSEDELSKVAGAIAALASFGWSIFDKWKTNRSKPTQ